MGKSILPVQRMIGLTISVVAVQFLIRRYARSRSGAVQSGSES